MVHISVLGIDIAKQIFHLIGMDDSGTVILRKRCPRGVFMSFMTQMPPVVIGMETCGGHTTEHGASASMGIPCG